VIGRSVIAADLRV